VCLANIFSSTFGSVFEEELCGFYFIKKGIKRGFYCNLVDWIGLGFPDEKKCH
jgi:hypothetical protein